MSAIEFERTAAGLGLDVTKDCSGRYLAPATEATRAGWLLAWNAALDHAARVPREYALSLDSQGWGNRFPDELTAIFNASTNMAENIRRLKESS